MSTVRKTQNSKLTVAYLLCILLELQTLNLREFYDKNLKQLLHWLMSSSEKPKKRAQEMDKPMLAEEWL